MVCKTVKPTVIIETDGEKVSYPSKCFYFTCIVEVIYKTLFFKVLYLFVKIVQHKQKIQENEEKKQFFQNTKKKHVA